GAASRLGRQGRVPVLTVAPGSTSASSTPSIVPIYSNNGRITEHVRYYKHETPLSAGSRGHRAGGRALRAKRPCSPADRPRACPAQGDVLWRAGRAHAQVERLVPLQSAARGRGDTHARGRDAALHLAAPGRPGDALSRTARRGVARRGGAYAAASLTLAIVALHPERSSLVPTWKAYLPLSP